MSTIDYSGLPEHMQGGFCRYFENHIEGGGFMNAVLSNNLVEALQRADHINRNHLLDIVYWLMEWAPSGSWGSPEAVEYWLDSDNWPQTEHESSPK